MEEPVIIALSGGIGSALAALHVKQHVSANIYTFNLDWGIEPAEVKRAAQIAGMVGAKDHYEISAPGILQKTADGVVPALGLLVMAIGASIAFEQMATRIVSGANAVGTKHPNPDQTDAFFDRMSDAVQYALCHNMQHPLWGIDIFAPLMLLKPTQSFADFAKGLTGADKVLGLYTSGVPKSSGTKTGKSKKAGKQTQDKFANLAAGQGEKAHG